MEPLIIITSYNRRRETQQTLKALSDTTNLSRVTIAIVDNGSTDGSPQAINAWINEVDAPCITLHRLEKNIGCPKALNAALLQHRQPGQPVVKLDNDVRILTRGWVSKVEALVALWKSAYGPLAMLSAYYPGVLEGRLRRVWGKYKNEDVYYVQPVIGHAVWHTAEFMDKIGFFDVLADDHLYGFEDLIMSHKASALKWAALVWKGWQIENVQRKNSLGEQRDEHVERMRPLFNERVRALLEGGPIDTPPTGFPIY